MVVNRLAPIFLIIFITSCSLLNSGTVSVKYNETRASFYGKDYRNREKLTDVSFSVRNVQHPKTYGDWNMNLRLSPSIHFDRNLLILDDDTVAEDDRENYPDIKIQRLSTFANLKLSTHTPIGAIVATAGYGVSGFHAYDNKGMDTYRTREIKRLDFVWVGFISKHFFLLTGPRYYYDGNWQFVYAMRIGYYWGRF